MTPLEAIQTATGNGALSLRRDDVGTLAKGKLADVILVDGDPTVDVRVLQDRSRLHHVFKAGVEVDLKRPWPQRRVLPRERVSQYSADILTWDMAMALDGDGDGAPLSREELGSPALVSSCPCSM
jgi:cytosine/adenosine deaminase-related metal-dependent hydrolase